MNVPRLTVLLPGALTCYMGRPQHGYYNIEKRFQQKKGGEAKQKRKGKGGT